VRGPVLHSGYRLARLVALLLAALAFACVTAPAALAAAQRSIAARWSRRH